MITNKEEAIELIQDALHEIADGNIDIYYTDIYKSLDSELAEHIEDARDKGFITSSMSIDKQIQAGQYHANMKLLREAVAELK